MITVIRECDVKKTRKPHRCFGCMGIIQAGSPAHVQVNDDMGVGSIYTHPYCEDIIREMMDEYDDYDSYSEGCVVEYLSEIGFEGSPEEYYKKEDQS